MFTLLVRIMSEELASKIRMLVESNKDYVVILLYAIKQEEEQLERGVPEPSWEWPIAGHTRKLLNEGIIEIVSEGRPMRYKLKDRETTKKVLRELGFQESGFQESKMVRKL